MLALTLAVLGQVLVPASPEGPIITNPAAYGLAFFEAFPAGGAGMPAAQDLCSQLAASERVGSFWCLNGDGTTSPTSVTIYTEGDGGTPTDGGQYLSDAGVVDGGPLTMVATGSPTARTSTICPSGPSCATQSGYYTVNGGSAAFRSAVFAPSTTGNFTACWLGEVEGIEAQNNLLHLGATGSSTAFSYLLYVDTSGRPGLVVSDNTCGGVTSTTILSSTITPGAPHLICGSFTTGSRAKVWLDGAEGGLSSTGSAITGPPCAAASSRASVSAYNSSGSVAGATTGIVRGSFYTVSDIGSTAIARIARAVLADAPTGAKGEALSETRASVQFCESSDGTGSLLPNSRPCITRNGFTGAQGTFVQSALRTEEFDNASWTKGSFGGPVVPVVTANQVVSPGGTFTADLVAFAATTGVQDSALSQTAITGSQRASVYVMGQSGSGTLDICNYSTPTTCSSCAYTSTAWTRCSVAGTSGAVGATYIGNMSDINGGIARSAQSVYLWGANVTAGASLRPYIPATSAAVTTAAEVPYFTLTSAPVLNSIEATIDTPTTYVTNSRIWSLTKDANNVFDAYIDTSDSNKLGCFWYVAGVSYTAKSASGVSAGANHRVSCSYNGTSGIACVDGTCTSTALSFTNFSGATKIYPGTHGLDTTYEIGPAPVIKALRADPSSSRFR